VYDHTSGYGNDNVILAKEGDMFSAENKQFLVFRLKDGWRYEDDAAKGGIRSNYEQRRIHFKQWDKVFDLSSFKLSRTNEDLFKDAYQMMNVRQLNEGIEKLKQEEKSSLRNVDNYLRPYLSLGLDSKEDSLFRRTLEKTTYTFDYDSVFL